MARNRMLARLAGALAFLAASAWGTWWAVGNERLPQQQALRDWAAFREELSVAFAIAILILLAFRTAHLAAAKRGSQARNVGHLQTMAAILLAILTFAALASDFSSTLISLGLVGFGLTLALQRPILSMAGWATIIFGNMFREGDRIQVGDLQGDVLAITLFTTRLWEIGEVRGRSPGRPTARVLHVSNAVFLEQPVANATSDTAIVFDEFVVNVAFEADLRLAEDTLRRVSEDILDPGRHENMASTYRRLTKGMKMETYFPDKPWIIMQSQPSWMDLRLRYLVDARRQAEVQTGLTRAWTEATTDVEAIPQVYPRTQPQAIGADGRPRQ